MGARAQSSAVGHLAPSLARSELEPLGSVDPNPDPPRPGLLRPRLARVCAGESCAAHQQDIPFAAHAVEERRACRTRVRVVGSPCSWWRRRGLTVPAAAKNTSGEGLGSGDPAVGFGDGLDPCSFAMTLSLDAHEGENGHSFSGLAVAAGAWCGAGTSCASGTKISSPKWHPLHTYAPALQIPFMDKLLDNGVDIDLVDKDGFTPLHKAITGKKEAVISHLLRKGSNPDVTDRDGATPLHYAVQVGALKSVKLLIKYRVDVNVADVVS